MSHQPLQQSGSSASGAAGSWAADTALGTPCPGVGEGHGRLAMGSKALRLGTEHGGQRGARPCTKPPPKSCVLSV